ncbi:hypothetical protein C8R43DRAFT_945263 [Mycena crocata]|nr:hypothetical protein C8R43DRAFT_945263 [Mycena crocata]
MRVIRTTALPYLVLIIPLVFGAAAPDGSTRTGQERMAPHPKRETNADRFQRGLGPLPPTRRQKNKRWPPAPSPTPCTKLSNNLGRLQLRRVLDGDRIGYIGQQFNRDNAYTRHRQPPFALQVAVPPIAPFGSAINLIAANAPDSGHPFFGAVDRGSGPLGTSEAGFAILSGTSGVRGNSPPSSSAGTSLTLPHGGAESQIWTMNCQTRQVTAQWTNADGSHPPTTIFYDPVGDFVGLTGDLGAFNAGVSRRAFEVMMTFVPVDK